MKKNGYSVLIPTYPIRVEAFSSEDVVLIAQAGMNGTIPIDQKTKAVIEVEYGNNFCKNVEFQFYLSEEDAETDNQLKWYKLR